VTKITVMTSGPYLVEGVEIIDSEGKPFAIEAGKPVALCRCGASATKPFCDGAHVKIGFRATETAASVKGK